ncbi:hypothetical protein HK101_009947 [Irineochytrium annulatum]|nr:hypothetical protein HK101_009947 [Irineochytrium annulatum]
MSDLQSPSLDTAVGGVAEDTADGVSSVSVHSSAAAGDFLTMTSPSSHGDLVTLLDIHLDRNFGAFSPPAAGGPDGISPAPGRPSTSENRDNDEAPDVGIPVRYRTMSINIDQAIRSGMAPRPSAESDNLKRISVHLLKPAEVYTKLSTHHALGLEKLAVERRAKDGKNRITPPKTQYLSKTLGYLFGGLNFLMWIGFVLALLSYQPLGSMNGGTPNPLNLGVACLLLLVILVSALFYAFVDWNASRIMKGIRSLISETAVVLRDGERVEIPSQDIVVGDVVCLSLGQRVPADVRITECSADARFDRALLTGEADPVPAAVEPTDENPLETKNLAFSSTFVVQGTATGVVFAIGDSTVIGHIVGLSGKHKNEMTTIQKEIFILTMVISTLALTFFSVSLIFYFTYVRVRYPGFDTVSGAILNAIGCLTSFTPAGLPVCFALALIIIARRMAARRVLVKNLATIETLGCMSVLASDKTGTLTMGKMFVQNVAFHDRTIDLASDEGVDSVKAIAGVGASSEDGIGVVGIAHLCCGASFDAKTMDRPVAERIVNGDLTDTAVLKFAEDIVAGSKVKTGYETLFNIPFDSKNKWMMTIVKQKAQSVAPEMLVKGAPDILVNYCDSIAKSDGTVVPLTPDRLAQIQEIQNTLSANGQRVLALCRRRLRDIPASQIPFGGPHDAIARAVQGELHGLTCVALLGIRDPPRADVPGAVQVIRTAGVKVFMITGDFRATAEAIARQVGILSVNPEGRNDVRRHVNEAAATVPAAWSPSPDSLRGDKGRDTEVWQEAFSEVAANKEVRALSLMGSELDDLVDGDWDVIAARYSEIVFSRTTPEQKLRIVDEMKKRGNTVAVTGDGVNDAPALKAADIGIAMGAGSDVAKEAASMILLENDFGSICVAIENGRLVFDNLKKVVLYLMPAGSYTEFLAVVFNVFFGMQIPLSTYLQVYFCIFNDVIMSISLMLEQPESDLMRRPPRNTRKDRLTDFRFFGQVYLFIGLMMWPSAMGMWFLYFHDIGISPSHLLGAWNNWGLTGESLRYALVNSHEVSPAQWGIYEANATLAAGLSGQAALVEAVNTGNCVFYVAMIFLQFGGLLSVRTRRVSILQANPFWGPSRNVCVPLGMAVSVIFGCLNIYEPGIENLFGTARIPLKFWLLPMALGLGILVMDEVRKLCVRTFPKSILAKIAW